MNPASLNHSSERQRSWLPRRRYTCPFSWVRICGDVRKRPARKPCDPGVVIVRISGDKLKLRQWGVQDPPAFLCANRDGLVLPEDRPPETVHADPSATWPTYGRTSRPTASTDVGVRLVGCLSQVRVGPAPAHLVALGPEDVLPTFSGGARDFQDQAFAGTKALFGQAETKIDMPAGTHDHRDVPAGKAPQVIVKNGNTLGH